MTSATVMTNTFTSPPDLQRSLNIRIHHMSASNETLYLYDTETSSEYAKVESDGLDVYFPESVGGWADVLDCRVEPYADRDVRTNCDFAAHVHKKYILVTASQANARSLPADD